MRKRLILFNFALLNLTLLNWHIPRRNGFVAILVGTTQRLREEFESLWEASSNGLNSTVFGITNTIKTSFGLACEEAGIEDLRFNDCRHTINTRMIASYTHRTDVITFT